MPGTVIDMEALRAFDSAIHGGSKAPKANDDANDPTPEPGVLSLLFLSWVGPYVRRGYRKALSLAEMPRLFRRFRSAELVKAASARWCALIQQHDDSAFANVAFANSQG